ncbi:MAG: hypothetical protein QOF01_1275 [Thermomicrobiales bacterium]|jgi:hypothetical protein|nr:hypothetical protein [Thermomicrobiales bacterium]
MTTTTTLGDVTLMEHQNRIERTNRMGWIVEPASQPKPDGNRHGRRSVAVLAWCGAVVALLLTLLFLGSTPLV